MSHAAAQLQQAAAVAARFQLSTWELSMHFVEALLIAPLFLEGADEALKASRVLSDQDIASLVLLKPCISVLLCISFDHFAGAQAGMTY